jgi:hypothetical protein
MFIESICDDQDPIMANNWRSRYLLHRLRDDPSGFDFISRIKHCEDVYETLESLAAGHRIFVCEVLSRWESGD